MNAADQPEPIGLLRASLWQAGFRPVALLTNQKRTRVPEWTQRARRDPPADAVEPPRRDYGNTGILCDGLRVIDIDVDDAEIVGQLKALTLKMLGDGPLIRLRSNSPRCALLYRAAQGSPRKRTVVGTRKNNDGSCAKVEVLGAGQQLHAFGKHPSGADLVWHPEPPGHRTVDSLPAVSEHDLQTYLAAAAPLIGATVPSDPAPSAAAPAAGSRTDLYDNELTADPFIVADAVKAIPNDDPANWEDWNRIGMAIWAATNGGAAGFAAWNEWSRKNSAYDEGVTRERWEHYSRSPPSRIGAGTVFHLAEKAGWVRPILLSALKHALASSNSSDGSSAASVNAWPDVDQALLESSRGEVPPLPLEVFSPAWRSWICATAEGTGAPVDYVALGLLANVAGVTGCGVFAEATPSWREPLVLWLALVGAPSMGKTPALAAARNLIDYVESEARLGDDARQRDHETKAEAARLAAEHWREDVAEAAKRNTPPPVKPAEACNVETFVPTQFIVDDTTIESVVDVVRGNPRGVILWRDELTGWLQNLARYSGGNDRPFWLERWSAASATVNRKGRSAVHVARLAASIVGGIQPDRLAEICADADDGMAARFLYAWPDRPPYKPLQERRGGLDHSALARLRRIAGISGDAENPRVLKLDQAAINLLNKFCYGHHAEAGDYEGLEAGWFGKGYGYVVRLACALTLLAWSEGSDHSAPQAIGAAAVRDAARLWADYFWPVARTIFCSTGKTAADKQARRTVAWLRNAKADVVSLEDLRLRALGRSASAAETAGTIARLVKGGVLRPVSPVTNGLGRPANRWEVNPAVRAGRPKLARA